MHSFLSSMAGLSMLYPSASLWCAMVASDPSMRTAKEGAARESYNTAIIGTPQTCAQRAEGKAADDLAQDD
ncbi:hypothetical protein FIBSPDRAFT_878004 [Athelia psychrophila]|uniref:Secreted protein n=1 Tax=Athelia psychrophila TaxID=1759441 RepID=A0A167VFX4_9AGAM|nr:hypothetical protein FIBSPDRAFT_878004 [Fibularhizoctonia sp. CBS 109695]